MNSNLISTIYDTLNRNKLSHAILIEAGTEADRMEAAKAVAKALVCTCETKPCECCAHCRKAHNSVHPDISLYEGGTTPGSFKVDFVREISRDAAVLPNESDKKVYILNRADTMSVSAQNALLKILEEPPVYVNFILLTPSKSAMLDTVISRVTSYSLDDSDASVNGEEAGKAHSIAIDILHAVANNNEAEILRLTTDFEKDRNALKLCCNHLYELCSEALISKLTDREGEASEFALELSSNKLIKLSEACIYIINAANANMNGNLLVTLFCSKMIS